MAFIVNAIKEGVNDVVEAVKDVGMAGCLKVAEDRIKEITGLDITVDVEDIPEEDKIWVMKTGINSICNDDTWDFLDDSEYNKRTVELWNQRKINKILIKVAEEKDYDKWTKPWVNATVDWEKDSNMFTIKFFPHAFTWESDAPWIIPAEGGYRRWWILRNQIVFGLQLFQLPGKCFYKSDYLEDFQDFDASSPIPKAKKGYKRWFQFRHWVIFWFGRAQWGWNYAWTTKPPKNDDGSVFTLDSVLSLPSMPSISLPSISLPSLPDVSMPSLPSVSMPSISAPSLSAPSLSAPDLSGISIPDTPKRPENPWACHGIISLKDLKMEVKGKDITFHNAKVTNFWENKPGHIDTEETENQKFTVKALNTEQAQSWLLSLTAVGVKEEAAPGGCCTIA